MTRTEAVVFLTRFRCVGMEIEGPTGKDTGVCFNIIALYHNGESRPNTINDVNNDLNMALCVLGGKAAREAETK